MEKEIEILKLKIKVLELQLELEKQKKNNWNYNGTLTPVTSPFYYGGTTTLCNGTNLTTNCCDLNNNK